MASKLSVLLLLFSLLFILSTVSSWKKEEFRNCNQTPFCKRDRGRRPNSSSLIVVNVDGDLTAKISTKEDGRSDIQNQSDQTLDSNEKKQGGGEERQQSQDDQPQEEEQQPSKPLILTLSAYQDGILLLKIDENQSLNPPKKRFEVPHVIESEFLNKKLWLQRFSEEVIGGDLVSSSIVYLADGYEAVRRRDPFAIFVRENSGGKRVISLNSYGSFDFGQLRLKKR
ncbi:hypothetical protein Ancab_024365 [Ancistrocladus abbreviatus]